MEGIESSFQLPPAAISPPSTRGSGSSTDTLPISPTSPEITSNLPVTRAGAKRSLDGLNLPPPPTRTRKIIQMKPKTQNSSSKPTATTTKASQDAAAAASTTGKGATTGGSTNSKKKQSGTGGAAGRKVARKTAHSLIERRRRSKMNEEFSTLKNMIPACEGQEMHKLSILQVSFLFFFFFFCARHNTGVTLD